MMNYLALHLVQWLIHGPWKGQSALGFAYTDTFPRTAWLPLLPGTRVHWPTLLLGLLLALLAAFLLFRTRPGYEIRVLGHSPAAARYAGIDIPRVTRWVVLCSGGAAGLAGVGEVAGMHHKLLDPMRRSTSSPGNSCIGRNLCRFPHPGACRDIYAQKSPGC